jgi:hypothetical protein
VAASPEELERAAAGIEERDRVTNVAVIGFPAGDRFWWGELGRPRIVSNVAEPQ